MSTPLVLVVEDSPEDREAYRRALGGRYELVEADSGEEALRLAREARPACILLDYSLGDTDALELLRELKGDALDFPSPVVVLTGQGNERVAVQAMKLGVEDYLVKGDMAGIADAIDRAIERHAARSRGSYRVLIVDDSEADREYFKRRLPLAKGVQFEFREAETAQEGLALARQWLPDCVLLDFALPDADGLAFLAELRAAPAGAGIAVVVLTGQGNESVAVNALKIGAQDYLVKSSAVDMLRQSIVAAVEKVRLQRKLDEQRDALERSEQLLRENDRRKDEFLSMLAHELRNPLAPLGTLAELLRLRAADPGTIDFVRAVLDRQVRHLSRLVDDLLDVSRITRRVIALRRERVDLAALLREALEDHRAALERAGLRLAVEMPERPLWVDADATRITQVVGNLLSNAIKFTPRGGSVSVGLAERDGRAALVVEDSGAGIAPELMPRVFEVFAQGERSLDREGGGLGLGLAIARGLVELHGGAIRAESAGLGRGARFTVELPVAGEPPVLRTAPQRSEKARGGQRVLVVDDNVDAAATLRLLLELQDFEVHVAHSGRDALKVARELRPSAVLCDIGLPGMDGFAVARELRSDPATRGSRLIAVTGYGRPEDRERALRSGFDDHVVKPADPQALLDKLA